MLRLMESSTDIKSRWLSETDTLTLENIYSVVEDFEGKFSLRVNPTLYKRAEYKRRKTRGPLTWDELDLTRDR